MVLPPYLGASLTDLCMDCVVCCFGTLVALSPTKTLVSAWFYYIIGASLTDLCMDFAVFCLGPLMALSPTKTSVSAWF